MLHLLTVYGTTPKRFILLSILVTSCATLGPLSIPTAFASPVDPYQQESSLLEDHSIAETPNLIENEGRMNKKKKKKKKQKKGNRKGKSDVTIKMKDREFRYNLSAPFLRHKATVKVCNRDKFIYEPWSTSESGVLPETHFFGEVYPGCRKKTYFNSEDTIKKLQFFDSIHPESTAAFCMYPKDQRCRKGAYTTNESGGVLECELQEKCCTDEEDNDNDGDVDCDDSDCADHKKCECREGEHSATKVIETGSLPNCGCYVAVFVQWNENISKNAESVTAVHNHITLGEQTTPSTEPYDDEFSIGQTTLPSVPAGSHRIHVAGGTAFDSNLQRCSPNCPRLIQEANSNISSDTSVRITCPNKKK